MDKAGRAGGVQHDTTEESLAILPTRKYVHRDLRHAFPIPLASVKSTTKQIVDIDTQIQRQLYTRYPDFLHCKVMHLLLYIERHWILYS